MEFRRGDHIRVARLCECGHGRDVHPFGRCLNYIPIELTGCPCTAYRPAPTPQPEPTGLAERAQRAADDALGGCEGRAVALAVADWLDERDWPMAVIVAARIRREVGESNG